MLLLLGCGAPEAEPGSLVLPPEDQSEAWDEAYAEADDAGGSFPMEAFVLGPDGEPAAGVLVSVLSGWDGASILAPERPPGRRVLDTRTGDTVDIGACSGAAAPTECSWYRTEPGADGGIRFAVYVDVAPDSGASVPVFISAGGDVASVEIEFADDLVVN